ncbi:MAG: aminotransferase class I/II-fold pyridoxal phosphate-dependent enzyme, partial [Nanoarchaeota archaeon]|nr:aminotransferase class I/II-fold pyridoxal phosphate-dependent enzyme [Nanoarchaeota archaeon]
MNPQAEELNNTIKKESSVVFELLSEKGKEIFYPAKGILAQSADAKGKKINATIGIALEEDGSPMRLQSIAKRIDLDPKEIFPYAPSFGNKNLRDIWKEMLSQKNPGLKGKAISTPVVTNALTHGLSMIGYMFTDKKEKVILPDQYWGNYKLIFINAYGAELEAFETFVGSSFNVAGLKAKLGGSPGKKVVLLNFPNNPTGYTPTEKEVSEIVTTIKQAAEAGN